VVDVGENKIKKNLPEPSSESLLAAGRPAVHYMNASDVVEALQAEYQNIANLVTMLGVKVVYGTGP
jgi:hypothetical protein